MREGRLTYSKAEYDYIKRQRAFAWAKFYEAKQEQADNARLILQHIVVIGDTRRDAEIVDITDASPNNKVKVQYLDDGQQEDLDLT